MKKRIFFVVFVAALGAAAYLWTRPGPVTDSERISREPTIRGVGSASSATNGLEQVEPIASRKSGSSRSLEAVTKLSQMAEHARSGQRENGQALVNLSVGLAFCQGIAINKDGPGRTDIESRMSPVQLANLEYLRKFAVRFCDDPPVDPDEISRQFLALDDDDEVLQARMLVSLQGDEAVTIGIPMAERLFLQAKSADAMERSAAFLLASTGELPLAKGVPIPASIGDRASRNKAQQLAIRMLACDMQGGCGSGGFQTALYCGSTCRAGISLEQVWAKTYSPEAIAYARALEKVIKDSRTARP